jgi:estrogen-related receptor beta like 1
MKHSEVIATALPATEGILKQIGNQLGGAVEKMKSKEKYLNTSFSALCNEYQAVKASLNEIEDKHSSGTESVSALTNELAIIQDQLSEVKGTMDSRGSSMTDTSPLVKIKAALQDIKV